jgi:hypothetical protein
MNDDNYFASLNAINVNEHIEKKGAFSYLSWPFAVSQLRIAHPTATWEVKRFDDMPYLKTECGYFVEVVVTVEGVSLSQIHPVLDGKNRPIFEPTVFDINTSIQRCLVKAIALHGLGLYIYAGEDLPDSGGAIDSPEQPVTPPASTATGPTKPTKLTSPPVTALRRPSTAPTKPTESLRGTISPAQQAEIQRRLRDVGGSLDRLLAYFQIERIEDIQIVDYDRVIRSLEKRRAA